MALTALALAVAGCAGPRGAESAARSLPPADGAGPLVVAATFTVLADIVHQVGGTDVEVTSVTGPEMNVHGYEPSPDDLRRVAESDLVIANGLGLETWLRDLVDPLGVPTVVVTDGIEPLPIAGSAAERGRLVHNPHAWVSPRSGREYVAAVAAALAAADPARADRYGERAARYAAELLEVERWMAERLATVPEERRVLVTCEGAFSYLARDMDLREVFLWPVNAERQGTPRQTADRKSVV